MLAFNIVSLVLLNVVLSSMLLLRVSVFAVQCNSNVQSNILSATNVRRGFLNKLIKYSPYKFVVNVNNTYIQTWSAQGGCVTIDFQRAPYSKPGDKRAVAYDTLYYNDTDQSCYCNQYSFKNPLIYEFREEEFDRGYLKETDKNNVVYDILLLEVYPVLCFYRCSNSSDADDVSIAGAAIPVNFKPSRQTNCAVQRCKASLQAAGVTETLVDLPPCSPPRT